MSDISNSDKRRLPYPLYDTKAIVGYSPDDGFSIVPLDGIFPDETTRVPIRLDLSLQEYVALASAVDVGRDIAYGDDSEWIWWIWCRAFRGASEAMSCEDVADCIETNATVQAALTNNNDQFGLENPDYLSLAGTESTTIINNRFPLEQREENAHTLQDCDLDELWAGILFMVQRLDERGSDWLEQIVSKADSWQRVAEFVGTIPIVGELTENVLLAFVNSAQDILNLYNAYSSVEQQEEIACDLFEMVCAECRYPTYQEIADYYSSFAIQDMQDWANIALRFMVDYLTGSSGLAAIVAYYSVITFQLWIMYAESTFFGLRGKKWIGIWLDNGEEFANDAWIVLCDGCEPQEVLLEIGLGDCAMGAVAGICTQTGFNQYQITSTLRGADRAVMLRRVGSTDNWRVVNAFHQSGTPVKFRRWCTDGVISPIGQLSGGIPNVCLDSLGVTVDDSDSDFTYIIEVEAC